MRKQKRRGKLHPVELSAGGYPQCAEVCAEHAHILNTTLYNDPIERQKLMAFVDIRCVIRVALKSIPRPPTGFELSTRNPKPQPQRKLWQAAPDR